MPVLPGGLGLLVVALLISVFNDPRKMRTALLLLAVVISLLTSAAGLIIGLLENNLDTLIAAYVLVGLMAAMLLTVVALAVFLIVTGITLLRKEGFAISRLLGLGLGVGMLGYVAAAWAVLVTESVPLAAFVLMLGLPLGYLGYGFVAFLLYGWLYPTVMARRGGPVAAIVVLGSGLIRGKVPPLLSARLDRGRQLRDRLAEQAPAPLMITSGGQGADEPVAEGEAMADYLIDNGVPADTIVVENRSRNTEQNLRYSAELLAQRGVSGPIAAVSNNFHAFRAALLMRRLKIGGYALGAPTARYYWPTAVIREYIAVLRDNLALNAVLLGLSCVPIVIFLVNLAVTVFSRG